MKPTLCRLPARFTAALFLLTGGPGLAADWTESLDGDISSIQDSPSLLSLSPGLNSLSGSVGGSDGQDWITLTIPIGYELSVLRLSLFDTGTDSTAFLGLAAGSVFSGSVLSGEDYLGYAHFGPGNVGVDLLPALGQANLAQGFTPPLPAGDYAFLIQQTGPSTSSYRFEPTVTAVPESGSALLLALGGLLVSGRKRRLSAPPPH